MQMLRYSFILFFIAVKKETYKKNNYTVACNDIICALLQIIEISLLIQHFVEAAAVIVSGFFGYIFTTGQSNKANRVKLLKFSYIHEFQPFRPLFLFFKLYLAGYEKSVNDHLQLCPGHWLGHSKTVRYSL